MDDLDNYKPLGWRRDLLHIISCYYTDQVGPVTGSRQWEEDSQAFIDAMEHRRTQEWLYIKELNPLDFMGYVVAVFKRSRVITSGTLVATPAGCGLVATTTGRWPS